MIDRLPGPIRRRYYRWRRRIEYRLAPDPYPIQVGSAAAEFDTPSRQAYHRVRTLLDREPIIERFLDSLADDAVVWDIGAHVGTYSFPLADALKGGSVLAFEPHPRNAGKLIEHREINDATNVEIYSVALSEECGTAPLTVGQGWDYGQNDILTDSPDRSINVQTRTVDSLVAEGVPEPTALKIDVEGAELDVLRGAKEFLSSDRCRVVLCEVHTGKALVPAVMEYLGGHGFDLNDPGETGWPPHVLATRDEDPSFP